jgi:putative membrane protein
MLKRFLLRWLVSSLGLWIAAALLGPERISIEGSLGTILAAGFFLALVNLVIKPFLIFLSLPALLITLGLFIVVINGLVILIVSRIYDPLYISSFAVAMVAGVIIGLVNYLVTRILEDI